jgi:hypothetical protein
MQYYAHKKFLVEVVEEKDGEVTLLDYEGKTFPVTEQRFKEYYIGVDLANDENSFKRKVNAARGYIEMGNIINQTNDENYIFDVPSNKPF